MAAPVPVIYPRELEVSANTKFYIRCNDTGDARSDGTKGYEIFFTLDGSKPDPDNYGGKRSTIKYRKPFTLDPGRHQIKALSCSKINRRAAPSSIASKYYEVDNMPSNQHSVRPESSRQQHVDPDIRAELTDVDDTSGTEAKDKGRSLMESDDELFDEAEYLATRRKFRLKRKLEAYGNTCELCKTPRETNQHGVWLGACTLCGYAFPPLGSTEIRETRIAADSLTPGLTPAEREAKPYVSIDAHGFVEPSHHINHNFTDTASGQQKVYSGIVTNTQTDHVPLLKTQALESVVGVNPSLASRPSTAASRITSQNRFQGDSIRHIERESINQTQQFPYQENPSVKLPPAMQQGKQTDTSDFKTCPGCQGTCPAHLANCAICYTSLVNVPIIGKPPEPLQKVPTSSDGACPNCSSRNAKSSRFCSWCGFKFMEQPARLVPVDIMDRHTGGGGDQSVMQNYTMMPDGSMVQIEQPASKEAQWGYHLDQTLTAVPVQPAPTVEVRVETDERFKTNRRNKQQTTAKLVSTASQTGLYFPSSKSLDIEKMRMEKVIEGKKPERTIFVGDVSPGNGYWRQQIDHALVKLKAYARETPSLQANIGEHRMGDVTAAQIREDGDQILLTISLTNKALIGKKRSGRGKRVVGGVSYSSTQTMQATQTPIEDFMDQNGSLAPLELLQSTAQKKSKREAEKKQLNKLTKALFVALQADGVHTQPETLLGLLDQGADVNGFNADRDRPLNVAALNGHLEAVKFLLDAGGDANAAGAKGDTPLHSVVRGGHRNAKDVASLLLESGAQTDSQNIEMLTPYALASELRRKDMVSFFGKTLSTNTLANMVQSKIKF